MQDMLKALVTSRKAWILLVCAAGVIALTVAGKATTSEALDFLKWLVAAWFGAVAYEDRSRKELDAYLSTPIEELPKQEPPGNPR